MRALATGPTLKEQIFFNAHKSGTLPIPSQFINHACRADIKTCQKAGKVVLLSLGGAIGTYGFSSASQATTFATTVWNLFGGGSSSTRPFGSAVVDGFDLGISQNKSY